jgi:hypothetical protein
LESPRPPRDSWRGTPSMITWLLRGVQCEHWTQPWNIHGMCLQLLFTIKTIYYLNEKIHYQVQHDLNQY